MNRKDFIKQASLLTLAVSGSPSALLARDKNEIQFQLLRHATCTVRINDKIFLVDPMLGAKNAYDPVRWTSNGIRNPMVDLPFTTQELTELIRQTNAVLITHTHNDHWDKAAQELIPKHTPLLTQPEDKIKLEEQGFNHVTAINNDGYFEGIKIIRTKGRHGKGEIGERMAPVSGFILDDGKQKIYVAGDTIWCDEVKETILQYQPEYIILNTGGATFDMGDPITMTAEDVLEVCKHSHAKKILCVHLETINHCYLKRETLRAFLNQHQVAHRCLIPKDGEKISLF